MNRSFLESTARRRVEGLLDEGTFRELLPPSERVSSPHLLALDAPVSFDDGVVVGMGRLNAASVLIAAQEGRFMGGAVGEVHGAKITGLLERAKIEKPSVVLLLIDSGGVRLHEANAGLIAVSEIIRAVLAAREAGVPVLAIIGGQTGCFGGMGIVACCCDAIVMSEESRLGLSGPEVIETSHGVEEFDSKDKALVWQTVGGKHRYLLGDATRLVHDSIGSFREAIIDLIRRDMAFSLQQVEQEHQALQSRLERFGECEHAVDIWRAQGIEEPERLAVLDHEAFLAAVSKRA